jgi:predicted Zn-dependent protease
VAAASLIAGSQALSVGHASAYALNGCKFFFANEPYANVANSAHAPAANNAANDWTNLTDINLSNTGNLNVLVLRTNNFGNTGYDGITTVPPCSGVNGVWTSVVNVYANTFYTAGYTYTGKKNVYEHEIGHALGLAHVTACNQIMYSAAWCNGIIGPQSDDIAGANFLY